MTHIETDNPIIRYYIWMYDLMWQYWYAVILLCVIAVWIISKHFAKRQREWNDYMKSGREKFEEFKRKLIRPEDIPLTRAWLEKRGWVPTNTIPMFRNNSACIDTDLCVVVDNKDYIIAKFHYIGDKAWEPSAKPYSFEVCGINNFIEMLDYNHTRLVMAAYVCHLTGFEEIDKAIGGVYEFTMNLKDKEL